uniref:Uncharacterized protein TCIL3000_11_7970 n=1 Tax=Trypanosoma congolense (strain IL3000) TaxID=1068625 RepID=G0V129_TRYCI|nr:unnamed protein product [Trypanosoma congolense IL3000]
MARVCDTLDLAPAPYLHYLAPPHKHKKKTITIITPSTHNKKNPFFSILMIFSVCHIATPQHYPPHTHKERKHFYHFLDCFHTPFLFICSHVYRPFPLFLQFCYHRLAVCSLPQKCFANRNPGGSTKERKKTRIKDKKCQATGMKPKRKGGALFGRKQKK